ncbi:MAG: ATP-dependent ligase [Labilithrix sp.]|nr:ATP-dependent ligase [Labilithrix sp.]
MSASRAESLAIALGARRGTVDGRRVVPMVCGRDETSERILRESGWHFELKLDGVRIVADKQGARVSLVYRTARDATASYPEVAAALGQLAEERVVLDGEIVAFDAEGRPDFQRLGTRIQAGAGRGARDAARRVPVVYVVFDVLAVGDHDVTGLPIEARKQVLEAVLAALPPGDGHVRMQPVLPDGSALFDLCRERRLEGVVAKRAGSRYATGDRSSDWVKVKCELDADLVVVGWTPSEGTRRSLGALDLAAYDGDRLVYCGGVGSGLDAATVEVLSAVLAELETTDPAAQGTYRPKAGRRHVRPALVVSVRHMGRSLDGSLRHPVFRGIRADLTPRDCTVAGASGRPSRTRT